MPQEQEQRKTERQGRLYIAILLCFAVTAVCVVFAVLCLKNTQNTFVQNNVGWLMGGSCALLIGYFSACVCFLFLKKITLFRSLISGYALILLALILTFVLQKTGFFYVVKDAERFQEYLRGAGAWMPALYIVLQYMQVVLLPIPGFVSTAAGVALFGPMRTFLYSFIGVTLGSLTAFVIGRKFGYKAVLWMVGKEDLDKWQKKIKGKDNFVLTAMFLLPVFPDDILCFIAGLSSMTWQYFFIMIVLSRLCAILTTCYSVNFIPFNTWWGISIWITFILLIILIFILLYKYLDQINAWFNKVFKRKKSKKSTKEENDP